MAAPIHAQWATALLCTISPGASSATSALPSPPKPLRPPARRTIGGHQVDAGDRLDLERVRRLRDFIGGPERWSVGSRQSQSSSNNLSVASLNQVIGHQSPVVTPQSVYRAPRTRPPSSPPSRGDPVRWASIIRLPLTFTISSKARKMESSSRMRPSGERCISTRLTAIHSK